MATSCCLQADYFVPTGRLLGAYSRAGFRPINPHLCRGTRDPRGARAPPPQKKKVKEEEKKKKTGGKEEKRERIKMAERNI